MWVRRAKCLETNDPFSIGVSARIFGKRSIGDEWQITIQQFRRQISAQLRCHEDERRRGARRQFKEMSSLRKRISSARIILQRFNRKREFDCVRIGRVQCNAARLEFDGIGRTKNGERIADDRAAAQNVTGTCSGHINDRITVL